jgi:methionyl-tRNA synthetase
MLGAAAGLLDTVRRELSVQALHKMIESIWGVIGDANRYVDEQAPWALRKTDPARMATVLYVTAEVLRISALLTLPVMPESSAKLLDLLGVPPANRAFALAGEAGRLQPGVPLPPPAPVFPRYVEETTA